MKFFKYSFCALVVSGILHTVERLFATLAKGIAVQGYAYKGLGFDIAPAYPAFYENIYVVIFLALSIIFFVLGLISLSKKV